jgi:hypothetical protein
LHIVPSGVHHHLANMLHFNESICAGTHPFLPTSPAARGRVRWEVFRSASCSQVNRVSQSFDRGQKLICSLMIATSNKAFCISNLRRGADNGPIWDDDALCILGLERSGYGRPKRASRKRY